VTDLRAVTTGDTWLDLQWTSTGDDDEDREATACQLRILPGSPIRTEAAWDSSWAPAGTIPDPGTPGTTVRYRLSGLEPDSLYGIAVRIVDDAGNRSPLPDPPVVVRTGQPPPPEAGTLEVHLRSSSPDGFQGTSISQGDSVLVASASDSVYSLAFLPGTYAVRAEKQCAVCDPAGAQEVEIRPRETTVLVWHIDPVAPLEVESVPAGAEILLDGEPTGSETPATFACLPPGEHELRVRWFGYTSGADSVRTVRIGTETVREDYDFLPALSGYPRGVLLELFTATLCPNCPFADAAAESLVQGQAGADHPWTEEDGFLPLQVHCSWGGTDSLYNAAGAQSRINSYSANQGIPKAFFDGTREIDGAGQPPSTRALVTLYQEQIEQARSAGPAAVALNWSAPGHVAGSSATGRIRVTLLQDFADPAGVQVWAVDYKDDLVTVPPGHTLAETFHDVLREYKLIGTLQDLGLSHRGDSREVEVSFELGWDYRNRHDGPLWSEEKMGLVAFVQNAASKEIYQAAGVRLP
jgi:hypothetical protein